MRADVILASYLARTLWAKGPVRALYFSMLNAKRYRPGWDPASFQIPRSCHRRCHYFCCSLSFSTCSFDSFLIFPDDPHDVKNRLIWKFGSHYFFSNFFKLFTNLKLKLTGWCHHMPLLLAGSSTDFSVLAIVFRELWVTSPPPRVTRTPMANKRDV